MKDEFEKNYISKLSNEEEAKAKGIPELVEREKFMQNNIFWRSLNIKYDKLKIQQSAEAIVFFEDIEKYIFILNSK